MAELTILLSHERSGSHFVGEFLGALDDFHMFDEVGNPVAVEPEFPESFHAFRSRYAQVDRDYLLRPNDERQMSFVGAYFDHMKALGRGQSVGVDIKYGHVHLFESFWCPPFEIPLLLKMAWMNDWRILHLYRENVVEAAASALIADARRVWHSHEVVGDPTVMAPVQLDVSALVRQAKFLENQNHWFLSICKDRGQYFTLTYERAKAELRGGGDLDEELSRFVGGKLVVAPEQRHKKVTPPLNEALSNYNEVEAACAQAGLNGYLT